MSSGCTLPGANPVAFTVTVSWCVFAFRVKVAVPLTLLPFVEFSVAIADVVTDLALDLVLETGFAVLFVACEVVFVVGELFVPQPAIPNVAIIISGATTAKDFRFNVFWPPNLFLNYISILSPSMLHFCYMNSLSTLTVCLKCVPGWSE